MINEHYSFEFATNRLLYRFMSEGTKGEITKLVEFEQIGHGRFNLAFGDYADGKIDDAVISNNQDLQLVISTVAATVHHFYETHPASIVEIQAVDEKRLRFYNTVFRRKLAEIETKFQVRGWKGGKWEGFREGVYYEKFEIRLKNP